MHRFSKTLFSKIGHFFFQIRNSTIAVSSIFDIFMILTFYKGTCLFLIN